MAVTLTDVVAPAGQFNIDMFPEAGQDNVAFEHLINGFVEQGSLKATAAGMTPATAEFDRAHLAWANYAAALHIYNRLLTQPVSVTLESQGQGSFATTQIRLWGDKVRSLLADFNDAVSLPQTTPSKFPPSGHTGHKVAW